MSLENVDTVGAVGVIKDEKGFRLDPSVWTEAINVRCVDGEIRSLGGRKAVFGGALGVVPQFLMPVSIPAQTLWVWGTLTKLYVWDGITNTEVTRAVGGNYSASGAKDFQGFVFGGIPIVNNGVDVPQYWASPSTLTDFADLANWPATHKARVLRALGPHMVAINITKGATLHPHMIRWSHPADPGSVPASWDETDPTRDVGEFELPDVNSGILLEALNLRGQMFLYKERATWSMRFIGGTYIFAVDPVFETLGVLATRCVALTGDGQRHFVVTQDDIVVHDGVTITPIAEKRMRRSVFNNLDPSNYTKAFVFRNAAFKEMWFCYPTQGSSVPNRALIWNYETGAITEADNNHIGFVAAAAGPLAESNSTTWAAVTGSWDSYSGPWSQVHRERVLVADAVNSEIQQLDSGNLVRTATMPVTVQRTSLGLIGRKRDNTPLVDFNRRKLVTRVWPRATGGPINVRLASQEGPEDSATWTATKTFTPPGDKFVDLIAEGPAIGIEFSSNANVDWTLEGYKLDMSVDGEF